MTGPEQRKFRRFELKLPFELVRAGNRRTRDVGETKNLSSGGVFFRVTQPVAVGDSIEYWITLPTGGEAGQLRLHCVGKILRADEAKPAAGDYGVAATLERYEFVRP